MNWKKRLCGLQVGWEEIIRQTVSFFVCVCACVCGVEGGRLSEKIRHQMLLYKQNISNPHLSGSFALFNED